MTVPPFADTSSVRDWHRRPSRRCRSRMRQKLTAAHHREADLVFGEPIFTPQAIYAPELRKIAGDHREATASSVAGN